MPSLSTAPAGTTTAATGNLAFTGSQTGDELLLSGLLLASGGLLTAASRRRRSRSSATRR